MLRKAAIRHTSLEHAPALRLNNETFFLDVKNIQDESKLKATITKHGGEGNKELKCPSLTFTSSRRSHDLHKLIEGQDTELKRKIADLQVQGYLKDALRLGVKVRTYDNVLQWLAIREPSEKHPSQKKASRLKSSHYSTMKQPVITRFVKPVKKRMLGNYAIKIQDVLGNFRPEFKEFGSSFPTLNLAPGRGSPFDPPVDVAGSSVATQFAKPGRNSQRKSKHIIDNVFWCDLCECQVDSMRSHLVSVEHITRAEDMEQFAELDAELAKDYQLQGFVGNCDKPLLQVAPACSQVQNLSPDTAADTLHYEGLQNAHEPLPQHSLEWPQCEEALPENNMFANDICDVNASCQSSRSRYFQMLFFADCLDPLEHMYCKPDGFYDASSSSHSHVGSVSPPSPIMHTRCFPMLSENVFDGADVDAFVHMNVVPFDACGVNLQPGTWRPYLYVAACETVMANGAAAVLPVAMGIDESLSCDTVHDSDDSLECDTEDAAYVMQGFGSVALRELRYFRGVQE